MEPDTAALERFHPWPLRISATERNRTLRYAAAKAVGPFSKPGPTKAIGSLADASLLQPTSRESCPAPVLEVHISSTTDLFRSFEKEVIAISEARPYKACWSTPDHFPRGEYRLFSLVALVDSLEQSV